MRVGCLCHFQIRLPGIPDLFQFSSRNCNTGCRFGFLCFGNLRLLCDFPHLCSFLSLVVKRPGVYRPFHLPPSCNCVCVEEPLPSRMCCRDAFQSQTH
jgi:hypothetical protein